MSKKYFLSSLIILVFLVTPFPVLAAGIKYFEFAPDTGLMKNIGSIDVYQPFYPNNDFVSGFDIWVDNVGDSGTVSFGLRDANDNLLAAKTVSIPFVSPSWSGRVLHIDFDSPVAVSGIAEYKIKMATNMPNLRLYYANQVQLLQHNNIQVPVSSVLGPVRFGGVSQDFFFKIALYENSDTNPPVISNVTSSLISPASLKMEFNTNEPVDYQITLTPVRGGASQIKNWNGFYEFCNEGIVNCGATFPVEPNTTYNYQVIAKDYADNTSQINGVIRTAENPENPPGNPPVIFNSQVVAITPYSVKIAWQTDITADSKLVISRDPLGERIMTSISDPTFELAHTLGTNNILEPGASYFATLISNAPNRQSASQTLNVTTSNTTSSEDQSNQNQTTAGQNMNELIISTTTVDSIRTVEWTGPNAGEPKGGYRTDIFDANNTLIKQIITPAGAHKAEITDLPPGDYRFVTYANQGKYFEKVAKETAITIAKKSPPFFKNPLLYKIAIPILLVGAILAFYVLRVKKINQ